MHFYRDLADTDLVGDLLVETAGCDQGHHLTLARGEGLEARPQPASAFSFSSQARSRARPSWIASSKSWSRKGLVRNSIAPSFIALTDIGMSPYPVRKMIGSWMLAAAISR